MRVLAVLVVSGALGAALAGCGTNCQSACSRAFGPDECNVQIPGQSAGDTIDACNIECTRALRKTGELGDFDPDTPAGEKVVLENEKQAAVWMDCVEETSCDNINLGFCAGGGI